MAKSKVFFVEGAPKPVGAYPHARREGDLLFLSGIGPRKPGSDEIPGVIRNEDGEIIDHDIRLQTESVIENIRSVLAQADGGVLEDVIDVMVFLVDINKDFAGFNEIYAKHFAQIQATRTTVEVRALPTPIAVEFKVIARARG